jgi:hypothetical protein
MTSFRSWMPLAFSLVTSASRSSTAKQTWLNPRLSSVDPTISQALSPSSSQGSQASLQTVAVSTWSFRSPPC